MAAHASFSKDSKTVLTPKARKRKNTSLPELQTLSKITAEQSQIERLEDVFQDEIIIAFANITSFKKFARSKNGLCLDQSYINTIVEDHRSNVQEQKLEILFKWQEIQGKKATVPKVRHLLQKYFKKDNPSDYIVLEEGIFGIYKNCFLCERSQVYLGEQISEVTGIQTRAIKLVLKNDKNLREAQILVKLESHVNVVSMIHAGIYHADIADYIYIAMERSWTQTVRNLLKECIILGKPLTEFLAWSLVGQLMKAVKFLHSHNIIHRDLKPENVLASDDWRHFKVTDFGLSKLISDGISTVQTNANIGTEGYRSGETYKQNAKITAKVDVFSAGVTIGEIMANGKHPFGEDPDLWTHNIKTNKNLDLSHVRVFNEGQVIVLIKRMLEMEPEKRPTAKEVLNDVSRLFQMFHLNNQQSSTDESATAKLRSSKARLSITKKVLTGTTADESLTTTSKAITEEVLTGTIAEADESLASTSKARTELSITEKVLTGTTADEILASTSKAMTELSITEKVNAIIMFNEFDKHLYSFNLPTKEWRRMQVFPECDSKHYFTTVVSGKHIYFIQNQKVYQLEYYDSAAEWKEMSSTIEQHGEDPPSAVLNGLIYVCGSGYSADSSRSVERYGAALDRWDDMCDMNTARYRSCVVATEDHIYCIGGGDEQYEDIESVERFDERLNKWEFVESAPRPIGLATAAVVENRIYVTGLHDKRDYDDNADDGLLCYDIQNDSWSEIDLMIQWPFSKQYYMKILAVDEELYVMGFIRKWKWKSAIYLLEPETKQMTLVEEFDDNNINPNACLAVKL